MATHFFRADIQIGGGLARIRYPGPTEAFWYDNVDKVLVKAYDDPNNRCLCITNDDGFFATLQAAGGVTELTQVVWESEVATVRFQADVFLMIHPSVNLGQRTAIENVITAQGLTFKTRKQI